MAQPEDATQREKYVRGVRTEVAVARTRSEAASLSGSLVELGIAGASGGSVSVRVTGADLFLIKPAAGDHDDLAPENMVLCDLAGDRVLGTPGSEREPVRDASTHAHLLRRFPELGGVVFSQSPYALVHAATGQEIPCLIASMAEAIGGPVPVASAPLDDADAIAEAVAAAVADGATAVVATGLGVFAVGATAAEAVRTAQLVEDVARTAVLARLVGSPTPLSPDTIRSLRERRALEDAQTTADRR